MPDSNNDNTFYMVFNDEHVHWSLAGCALTFGVIATFGIILNFCVIFVTIRSKSFRGTIHYLLSLYSFYEMLHQSGHFLFAYTALSGHNFIEFRLAAKILFLPLLGLGAFAPTMLFIAIDRLIGIVFDEMHNKMKIRTYLAVITAVCSLFGFILCFSIFQEEDGDQQRMITGCLIDLFKGNAVANVLNVHLIMFLMSFIIYLFVGIVIRIKSSGLPSAQSIQHRTFRALFCIIAINFGGYIFNLIFLFLIKPSISSPITAWFWHAITSISLNIGAASNAPILYFTSTDYREAFQKELPFVFKRTLNPVLTTHTIAIVHKNIIKTSIISHPPNFVHN